MPHWPSGSRLKVSIKSAAQYCGVDPTLFDPPFSRRSALSPLEGQIAYENLSEVGLGPGDAKSSLGRGRALGCANLDCYARHGLNLASDKSLSLAERAKLLAKCATEGMALYSGLKPFPSAEDAPSQLRTFSVLGEIRPRNRRQNLMEKA